jgi:hypothetical protein
MSVDEGTRVALVGWYEEQKGMWNEEEESREGWNWKLDAGDWVEKEEFAASWEKTEVVPRRETK